jgi:membrane carboxypeptidase/penicillin-binding protein PbpC
VKRLALRVLGWGIATIVLLTEYREHLSMSAARLLLFELEVRKPKQGMRGWHRTYFLWWMLVKLHLSEDEQLAIICSKTFLGRRSYGFEAGAQAYFQRPLARLTDAELATLVVIARSPSRWQRPRSHDDLLKARDGLLARVRGDRPAPH